MFQKTGLISNLTPASDSHYRTRATSRSVWETEIARQHRFRRLTVQDKEFLEDLLRYEKDADSFLTSPVYFMFTCRKGLWIYQNESAFVLLGWHPNVPDQILVFPPKGKNTEGLLKDLLDEIPFPRGGVCLARVKLHDQTSQWMGEDEASFDIETYSCTPKAETVLDWQYPVRVLSTEVVSHMHGGTFAKTRSHIRQLAKNNIDIAPFSPALRDDIMDFARTWASRKTDDENEIAEFLAPYECILDLAETGFALNGLVFFINGEIQAFCMWESANDQSEIANAWINLCNVTYNALSDLVIKTVAEKLFDQGISYLNFGGSETKQLDDFKKKFLPAYSLNLHSISIAPLLATKVA